ncbi:MAG: adenylate/guanylate cyclase domain-containing protein [Spirochaetia bacterium]
MKPKQKDQTLKAIFLQEEYQAELVIAVFRMIVYFTFTMVNVLQAITMGVPVVNEVLPLFIAFVFSVGLYIDTRWVGKRKHFEKFFSKYNKYLIVFVDVVIICLLMFSIKVTFETSAAIAQYEIHAATVFPFLFGLVALMYLVIDIFRFNVSSSYFAGGLFVIGYVLVSYLYGPQLYADTLFLPLTSVAAIALLLTTVLCAFLSDRIAKVIIKSKKQEQLERFLPESIARDYLKNNISLDETGKRQTATILFADIRNFTAMTEAKPPEEVVEFLNTYFNNMIEVIFHYKGSLDKIVGDELMAVFGAPITAQEFCTNAVQASVDMLRKLKEFNAVRRMQNKEPVKIGVGIHTGEVLIGKVGAEKRMDFTAIGDTVNTASRLQHMTKQYGIPIILSETTKEYVNFDFQYKDLGNTEIRGRKNKLRIYGIDPDDSYSSDQS